MYNKICIYNRVPGKTPSRREKPVKGGRHVVWIFFAKPNGFTKKFQTLYIVNLDEFRQGYGKIKINVHFYQKVEIFIQKLNINGLHKDIQNLSER